MLEESDSARSALFALIDAYRKATAAVEIAEQQEKTRGAFVGILEAEQELQRLLQTDRSDGGFMRRASAQHG